MGFHYSTFTPKRKKKCKHQKLILHIIVTKDEIIMSTFFNQLKIRHETCLQKRNLILLRWHEHQLNNTCPIQIRDAPQHFCKHTETPSAPPLAHLSRPGKSSRSCGRHSVGNTREKQICSELALQVHRRPALVFRSHRRRGLECAAF